MRPTCFFSSLPLKDPVGVDGGWEELRSGKGVVVEDESGVVSGTAVRVGLSVRVTVTGKGIDK